MGVMLANIKHIIDPWLQASTLLAEGHLDALCPDLSQLPKYWEGIVQDFPAHPILELDPGFSHSIGCTLYGRSDSSENLLETLGDEVDSLGDNWMFLLWSSDLSPCLTHCCCKPVAYCCASCFALCYS